MYKFLAGLLLTFLCASNLEAEHIIGGEMYYTCNTDGSYDFTMKLYRDCNGPGADFDEPANFAVFNSSNQLVLQLQDFIDNVDFVVPDLSSPCIAIPPNICVQEGVYNFTVFLPDNSQAYQVVYQRCCRNQTIQNLNNPGAQGLTIRANIPAFDNIGCNDRPYYNNFPPPILCAQEFLQFDHSATDPDGDSLSYKLCAPLIGGTQADPAPVPPSNPPYPSVNWAGGFSNTNPINANPGLAIDPLTGFLTGTPTQLGQFVIGVCVEEWRDGYLLSTNTRDFQFNVAYCELSSTALIAEPQAGDLCQDLTFDFINLSNPNNEFVWDFGDESTNLDVSNAYSPSYTYPDTGIYYVTMITNPGFFCSDTTVLELPLFFEVAINVEISNFECINDQQVFSFAADGEFDQENGVVIWDFGPNANPSTGTGLSVSDIIFSTVGDQTVDVQVLNNICTAQDQVIIEVPPPPEVSIVPQALFCNGLNYQFSKVSQFASIFNWDFGVSNTDADVASGPSVGYTFPDQGFYTVSLTAQLPNNCPITTTEIFDIRSLLAPEIEDNPVACLEANSIDFFASGSYSPDAQFIWSFEEGNPGISSAENPSDIVFSSAGTHAVSLSISEHGCTRSAQNQMIIHNNPVADFTAFPLIGCAPLKVQFKDLSTTQSSSVAYTYSTGDGNELMYRNAFHTYDNPGTYSVSLLLQNLNGCIDSDEIYKQNIIEVHPTPKPGFDIEPDKISALNPIIEIIDLSEGSSYCSYFFDNQLFETCNISHLLQNVMPQTIKQTVTNEYGCVATIEGEVFITDHLIYIPTAFTPDGDGTNDIFMPITTGVSNLEMHIFDRWGQKVFSETDVKRGWDGESPTDGYYTNTQTFQYVVIATDLSGWNFEYKGSLTLLR